MVILHQNLNPNNHVVILHQKVKPKNHVVILHQKGKPNKHRDNGEHPRMFRRGWGPYDNLPLGGMELHIADNYKQQ